MDVALKGLKTGPDQETVFICAIPFAVDNRSVGRGSKLRGDDPLIRSHPQFFVTDGTPTNEWPSVWDGVVKADEERDEAEAADAEAAFTDAARKNRLKLEPPTLHRAVRDFVARYNGAPTTILKGSVVIGDDPLVHEQPESWEAA
jgi:hypothetical protein